MQDEKYIPPEHLGWCQTSARCYCDVLDLIVANTGHDLGYMLRHIIKGDLTTVNRRGQEHKIIISLKNKELSDSEL